MRIILDTNILLDSVLPSRPSHKSAHLIIEAGQFQKDSIFACSLSLKDVYYLLCRQVDEPTARRFIKDLLSSLTILNVDEEVLNDAITSNEPDFEDGIIRACAENNDIDFIITRDTDAYQKSKVRSIPSDDFCKNFL